MPTDTKPKYQPPKTVEMVKPGAGRVRCLASAVDDYKSRGFVTAEEYAAKQKAAVPAKRAVEKKD